MDKRLVEAEAALKAGRDAQAVELIMAALTDDPSGPLQAYRVLLRKLWHLNRYEDGAVWSERVVKLAPKDFELLNLHGVFLRRTGRYEEAVKALDQAQRLKPKDITPLVNKGNIYNDTKNGPAAEAIFAKLVRMQPRVAEYQRGLARALLNQKKFEPAAVRLRQAISLKRDYVDAWLDMAALETERGDLDEALAVLDRAEEAAPEATRIFEAKVSTLRIASRYRDAQTYLEGLLDRFEGQAWIHFQLARVLSDGDRAQANVHFRRALELAPDKIEYRLALAESLERTRGAEEGLNIDEAYRTLLQADLRKLADPGHQKVANEILGRVGDYARANSLGSFVELGRSWAGSGRQTALLKHLSRAETDEDRLELIHQHRIWGDLVSDAVRRRPIKRPPIPKSRSKIRVGFMSSDLRNHPVAYFALPLFQSYDRDRFEVYCYSYYLGEEDPTQKQITEWVDAFRWRKEISDRDAAQMIADDQLDMLFELGGSTYMNKLNVMAFKPAPLSASWVGYPHSAGLKEIDYIVVDPYLMPEDPRLLIEKPMILPNAWYALGERAFREDPAVNPQPPVARNGFVTFGTANNTYKYNERMVRTWARTVARTPDARFMFVRPEGATPAFRENMIALFGSEGVSADRLKFEPVRGRHLPFYNEIDIALDTFPQTGGTTTCESLWMGVPVVTLVGPAMYERLSYSVLMNIGLSDLCAFSVEQYMDIATDLAADPARIADLRAGMRARMKASPLGDTKGWAKDFYAVVEKIVREHRGEAQAGAVSQPSAAMR